MAMTMILVATMVETKRKKKEGRKKKRLWTTTTTTEEREQRWIESCLLVRFLDYDRAREDQPLRGHLPCLLERSGLKYSVIKNGYSERIRRSRGEGISKSAHCKVERRRRGEEEGEEGGG